MAIQWGFQYERQFRWLKDTRHHLYRLISIPQKQAILEPGCSIALITEEITSRSNGLVVGLDTDLSALVEAKQRSENLNLVCGDIYTPPFRAESFDSILFQFFLLWLKRPQDALRAMTRMLMDHGTVTAIAEPDYGGRIDFPEEMDTTTYITERLIDEGADPFVGRKLEYLFRAAALRDIQWGLGSIPFGIERVKDNLDREWQFLHELAHESPPKWFKKLKNREEKLLKEGRRSYFMPVFYCTGEK